MGHYNSILVHTWMQTWFQSLGQAYIPSAGYILLCLWSSTSLWWLAMQFAYKNFGCYGQWWTKFITNLCRFSWVRTSTLLGQSRATSCDLDYFLGRYAWHLPPPTFWPLQGLQFLKITMCIEGNHHLTYAIHNSEVHIVPSVTEILIGLLVLAIVLCL